MPIEIKVPSVGESVQEAILAQWLKKDGDSVEKDEPLFVIETDKVTLEVVAEAAGRLSIQVQEGESVAIGAVVGTIDTEAQGAREEAEAAEEAPPPKPETDRSGETAPPPKPEADRSREAAPREDALATEAQPESAEKGSRTASGSGGEAQTAKSGRSTGKRFLSPSLRRLATQKGLDAEKLADSEPAEQTTEADSQRRESERRPDPETGSRAQTSSESQAEKPEGTWREPMSPIRRRIAEHLLEARRNTAMLTTFNEIDMGRTMETRNRFKEAFQNRYEVSLGFMSFFTKACVVALQEFPRVNAFIDERDVVYHDYCHIGIAIGSGKGLVVPVVRNADRLSFAEIEASILEYARKVKENRLELADLEGGTFTISNGGVYGSLLSTPILNMPQSAILGLHKIEKRPVVVDDRIEIRPMMYVALSYDHRIIDGREAVTFLKRIKECIEHPERMLLQI